MIYNPETFGQLEVTMRLIVDAYNFVTGRDLDAADFPQVPRQMQAEPNVQGPGRRFS